MIRYTRDMGSDNQNNEVGHWHRWYWENWAEKSPFVKEADYETIGMYFCLLQLQMAQGHIPSEPERIVKQLKLNGLTVEKFKEIWFKEQWPVPPGMKDENRLCDKFVPMTHGWDPAPKQQGKVVDPREGKWVPLAVPRPDLLHNEFMTQVITIGVREKRGRSLGGTASAALRAKSFDEYDREIEAAEQAADADEEAANNRFDWTGLLKLYPRRKDKVGLREGMDMVKNTIDTEENYARLKAAITNYAKQRKGEDPKYTKNFARFMREWTSYVPTNFRYEAKPKPIEVKEVSPTPQAVEAYRDTQDRLDKLRGKGMMIDDCPWEPRGNETPAEQAERAARWPEEKRADWLNKYLQAN